MELHLRNGSSPAVRSLAGWYERVDHPVVRREVPGGRIVLVISFGPPLDVDGSSYGSFVAGLHETAAITEHEGVSHGVQAYLSPLGAERLFRMPMGELANRGADLGDLLPEADELAERLYEAPDWPTRLTLLEAFIVRRAEEAPPVPRAVEWSWQRLLSTDGAVPVASLAEEVGWSRRHLAARFREHVGLPPKVARPHPALRARRRAAAPRRRPVRRRARQRLLRPGALQPRLPRLRGRDPDRVPGHIRPRHGVRAPRSFAGMIISTVRYTDAEGAFDFLERAFGLQRRPGGTLEHSELTLGRGMVMVGTRKDGDRFETGRGVRLRDRRRSRRRARPREGRRRDDRHGAHRPAVRLARVRRRGSEGNVWRFGTYDPFAT